MNFGIPAKSMEMIKKTISLKKEIEKAVIFGSRSMGNFKNGSDVDIAIYGTKITRDIVNKISVELNEILPLPYYFDIINYETLENDELKRHIDQYGKVFYKRG